MTPVFPGLERLLPHRPPMVLVDGVESWDANGCVARCTVPLVSPWVGGGRLLRSAFVEVAAQTAALHAGLAGQDSGEPVRHGYLGMVSDLRIHGDARTGDVLRSVAHRSATFGALARYACRIERIADGTLLAEGVLTVAMASPSAA